MIRSLSPYYISTPWNSPATALLSDSYTLYIYVWNGLKASPPGTATYEITKVNYESSTGTDKINISHLINDYIEFAPQEDPDTNVIDGNNQWWVKTEVTYVTTNPTDATTPQNAETSLFGLGYSYGNAGENIIATPSDILMTGTEFKVNRAGVFCVPIMVDEATTSPVTVISYPGNEINFSSTEAATTDSSELVKYIWVDLTETTSDTYVEVVFNAITITLLIEDECKYVPIDVFFQNKYGAQQCLTFFKERTDSLSVTSEEFESDRGQPSLGNHQFVRYNVQGRGKITVNTGWIDEEMNETIREFIISERHWGYNYFEATISDSLGGFNPFNIDTKSLEYKTRRKDKLIQYSIVSFTCWDGEV